MAEETDYAGVSGRSCTGPGGGEDELTLGLAVLDQPLQGHVDVLLLLARDRVAADLAVLDRGQIPELFGMRGGDSGRIHSLYQLTLVQSSGEILFVA